MNPEEIEALAFEKLAEARAEQILEKAAVSPQWIAKMMAGPVARLSRHARGQARLGDFAVRNMERARKISPMDVAGNRPLSAAPTAAFKRMQAAGQAGHAADPYRLGKERLDLKTNRLIPPMHGKFMPTAEGMARTAKGRKQLMVRAENKASKPGDFSLMDMGYPSSNLPASGGSAKWWRQTQETGVMGQMGRKRPQQAAAAGLKQQGAPKPGPGWTSGPSGPKLRPPIGSQPSAPGSVSRMPKLKPPKPPTSMKPAA